MVIQNSLDRIAGTVEAVLTAAERGSQEPTLYRATWQNQTAEIQDKLQECRMKLLQAGDESQSYDGASPSKKFTQKLPPMAFAVARETRELVRRIQEIKADGGPAEEDFS